MCTPLTGVNNIKTNNNMVVALVPFHRFNQLSNMQHQRGQSYIKDEVEPVSKFTFALKHIIV